MKCGICGAEAAAPFRAPTAEMAPDLDGRPGEPARSTLRRWIATCRNCGASAPDLSALPQTANEIIGEPAYMEQRSAAVRWAMIAEGLGSQVDAAEAYLQAAWAADDANDADAARAFRLHVAALWESAPRAALRRVDVLRRAGDFAAASSALDGVGVEDDNDAAIVAFQRARIAAGDPGRHLISSALRPPARTPHVTHVQKKSVGFLSRLFGR